MVGGGLFDKPRRAPRCRRRLSTPALLCNSRPVENRGIVQVVEMRIRFVCCASALGADTGHGRLLSSLQRL